MPKSIDLIITSFFGVVIFFDNKYNIVGRQGRHPSMVEATVDTRLMPLRVWGSIPLPTAPKPSLIRGGFWF